MTTGARAATVRGVGLVAIAGLALAACGGGSPGSEGQAASSDVTVTITGATGCEPSTTSLRAGAVTFHITNKDATGVSEVELMSGDRIVAEKENLPPGFSGSFAASVDAGRYTLYCPGAATERVPITVSGTAAKTQGGSVSSLLKTGTRHYAGYVTTQAGYLVESVAKLDRALHGSDLKAAQAAYANARPFYEKIEPVAESFAGAHDNLDADIDARAGDVPASQWRGFHRIEQGLFADRSLAGLATYGDELVDDSKQLRKLTSGLTYRPYELANGAQELLDEVAASKITGEEERYSHYDLLDIDNNVEGSAQAFADLQAGLTKIDPQLTRQIADRFAALDEVVDRFRTTANPSGFVTYDQLTKADKHRIAAAVKAVQEPLSRVASKVASA